MKPWTMWFARLGIAGACVMAVGCGEAVPDASSDGQAATDAAPPPDGGGAVPPATPLTQRQQPRVAGGPGARKGEEAPADEAAAPNPDAEKSQAATTPAGGSATAEMLAVATSTNGSATSQPNPDTAPAAPQGAPSAPMGSAMQQMMMGQGGRGGGPGAPGASGGGAPAGPGGMSAMMRPGAMGGGGGPNPGDMSSMRAQMEKQMQRQAGQGGPAGPMGASGMSGGPGGPGMAGRLGGGPGGPGGSPADDKPANFHSPEGAVEAFLSALRAKDADRLAEACALRASLEPPLKNQNLFKKIFDVSLSDSEMDELAKNFENYKIAGENPARSTARVEVVLQRSGDDGSFYRRVVTVRREGKDRKWGVLHLATPTVFKPLGRVPQTKKR
jgi:hypothetical protein